MTNLYETGTAIIEMALIFGVIGCVLLVIDFVRS